MLGVQWPYAATLAIYRLQLSLQISFSPLRFCDTLRSEALCTTKCDAMPFKTLLHLIWKPGVNMLSLSLGSGEKILMD